MNQEEVNASTAETTQSPNIDLGKLFEALAKAQLEMEVAKLNSANPYYKSRYANLPSIVRASRPYLAKNGLAIIQRVEHIDKQSFLLTRLGHSSGQWMESKTLINPPKDDVQTLGSYITYLKRYAYSAIVGVVADDGEDDDGEKAMEAERSKTPSKAPEKINKAQLQVLSDELQGFDEILDGILSGFKISKLSDMLCANFTSTMNRVRDIKRAKES